MNLAHLISIHTQNNVASSISRNIERTNQMLRRQNEENIKEENTKIEQEVNQIPLRDRPVKELIRWENKKRNIRNDNLSK